MPLFEYVCDDCKAAFEKIVPSYQTAVACVKCGGDRVEKQLSVFAVAGNDGRLAPDDPSCGRCGSTRPGQCGMQ